MFGRVTDIFKFMIQLYTTTNCSHCKEAKRYFESWGLEFEIYDIGKDIERREEMLKLGYKSVPIIVIGDETIVGWDKKRVESLLKKDV